MTLVDKPHLQSLAPQMLKISGKNVFWKEIRVIYKQSLEKHDLHTFLEHLKTEYH